MADGWLPHSVHMPSYAGVFLTAPVLLPPPSVYILRRVRSAGDPGAPPGAECAY